MAIARNVNIPALMVVSVFVLVTVSEPVFRSVLYVPSCLAPYVSHVLGSFMYPDVPVLYFSARENVFADVLPFGTPMK